MASCVQVERLLQAYIDDELSQSERVILAQHLSECRACVETLRKHQRMSATLFEAFADHRLDRGISDAVLDNLPEMAHPVVIEDMHGLNWRAKHPLYRWRTAARLVPLAVGMFLVLATTFLAYKWPDPLPGANAIGVVTYRAGSATCIEDESTDRTPAEVRAFVQRGQYYETGEDSTLMLTLAGPTQVMLNANSRIGIYSDRRVSIEKGQIWMDIGRDGRLFKASTPVGEIVVFGTAFSVEVDPQVATVTLARGDIQVQTAPDDAFRQLKPGQQVDMRLGEEPSIPREVDVEQVKGWTSHIVADRAAVTRFQRVIQDRRKTSEVSGQMVYVVPEWGTLSVPVKAIRLCWRPGSFGPGRCAYDVYVYDELNDPLFKTHVNPITFAEAEDNMCEIAVPNGPISGVKLLHIRLVPDYRVGDIEMEFTDVIAVGL